MGKGKLKWILGGFFTFFIIAFVGTWIYVSSKISPEEIRKIVLMQTQKVFPNANVEIGKIDLSLGLSISLGIDKMHLSLKDEFKSIGHSGQLLGLKDATVKIPLWAIIKGGGTVDILLVSPEIYYAENATSNNWALAQGGSAKSGEGEKNTENVENTSNQKKAEAFAIPGYLAKTDLNFRINDMKIHYLLKDKRSGNLVLSKFVVKNLNFYSPSAFEVDSQFNIKLEAKKQANFSILAIGQFNLAEYIKNNVLNLLLVVNTKDIKLSWLDYNIPDNKTDLNVKVMADSSIEGGIQFTFGNANQVRAKFNVKQKNVSINNLLVELFVQDLLNIANLKNLNLKAPDTKFLAEGDVNINPEGDLTPNLSFKLTPEVIIDSTTPVAFSARTTADGHWKGKRFELGSLTKIFDGQIDVTTKGELVLPKAEDKSNPMSKMRPLDIDIRLVDLKLSKDLIQKLMYEKKNEQSTSVEKVESDKANVGENSAVESSTTDSVAASNDAQSDTKQIKNNNKEAATQNSTTSAGVPARVNFSLARIKIDKEDFNGKGVFVISSKKAALEKFDFNFAGGNGSISEVTTFGTNSSDILLNMSMNKINMSGFNAFLPPNLKGVEGHFTGAVNGTAKTTPKSLKYDMVVNVNATKGEIKGLNLTEKVNSLLKSIPLLKDKVDPGQNYEVGSNFENFTFKGKLKDDFYQIDRVEFFGVNKKVEIKGGGKVFPPPGKESAQLDLDLIDNSGKLSSLLEKNIGTKVLPMRLIGPGFELKPDYTYTIEKLAKIGFETKAKEKIKQKVEEKVKEKVQDVLGDKIKNEGVNKLLKGFFK